MRKLAGVATEFLGTKRIAVTGVSRDPANHGGNVATRFSRSTPTPTRSAARSATTTCGRFRAASRRSSSRPGRSTRRRPCASAPTWGVGYVWLHRSFGAGSVSAAATEYGRQHGITVIDGGCPLMFPPASDPGHRFMRLLCHLPKRVWERALRGTGRPRTGKVPSPAPAQAPSPAQRCRSPSSRTKEPTVSSPAGGDGRRTRRAAHRRAVPRRRRPAR